MNIDKVIQTLEKHNDWRRHGTGIITMQNPKEVGEAIDEAVKILKAHRSALKTIEDFAGVVK